MLLQIKKVEKKGEKKFCLLLTKFSENSWNFITNVFSGHWEIVLQDAEAILSSCYNIQNHQLSFLTAVWFKASSPSVCVYYLLTCAACDHQLRDGHACRCDGQKILCERKLINGIQTVCAPPAGHCEWLLSAVPSLSGQIEWDMWRESGGRCFLWGLLSLSARQQQGALRERQMNGMTSGSQAWRWCYGVSCLLLLQIRSSAVHTVDKGGNGVIGRKKKLPWCSRLTCFQPKCSIRLKWNWQGIRMSFRRTWWNNLQSRNWCSVSVG